MVGIKLRRFKLLITVGAGFIGSHLVDNLMRRGWDLLVLDNLSSGNTSFDREASQSWLGAKIQQRTSNKTCHKNFVKRD